jgi:hypothetical protein
VEQLTAARPWRFVLGLLAAALLTFAPVAPAAGHTDLLSSSPNDGGQVDEAPENISLEFVSAFAPSEDGFVVRGPDGEALPVNVLASTTKTVFTIEVREPGAAGVWTVEFDGISTVDGHQVSGSFVFVVGSGALAAGVGGDPGRLLGGVGVLLFAVALGLVVLLRGLVEPAAARR